MTAIFFENESIEHYCQCLCDAAVLEVTIHHVGQRSLLLNMIHVLYN
jgi:hypothetical protein